MRFRPLFRLAAATLLVPVIASAQITVLLSGGIRAAYDKLLPEFEKSTGIAVTTLQGTSQGSGTDAISAQLRRGVYADVLIMSKGGFDELTADGRIAPGSLTDVATVPLGVAVRAGIPKPDIRTADAFRQALLRAKSITYDSTAAIHMDKVVLPRLGIGAQVAPKVIYTGPKAITSGKSEMVVDPVSAVMDIPGGVYVGPLPAELQLVQTFSTAVVSGSKQPEEARRLVAYLRSVGAQAAIKTSGMEPVK